MNNIALITGANGMDAKALTRLLLSKDYKVILTYRRSTYWDISKMKSLFQDELTKYPNSELYFEPCDISDQNSVNECLKSTLKRHSRIDELYLLAANSHVGESFKNKELCILVNGQSVYFFLECLKNFSPSTRTYFAGTSELIGGIESGSFNENTPWNPRSAYSIGKELGARWMNFYRDSTDIGMFCCVGILGNHSNCERTLDFAVKKITNTAARIALGKQDKLKLGHLEWARDESWADFSCEGMWQMLQQEKPENYVLGNGIANWGTSYVDLAFKHFNLDWHDYVEFDKTLLRPNEVVRLVADSTKAQQKLGWIPERISFKQHIDLMCDFDYQLEQGLNPKRPDVFNLTKS